jgi:hypothetical protein
MGYMKELEIRIYGGGEDALEAAGELLPQWYAADEFMPEDGSYVVVKCVLPDTGDVRIGVTKYSDDCEWQNIHDHYVSTITHWTYVPDLP